jgi:UDP-2,3-diacylglucosamine hydrolase
MTHDRSDLFLLFEHYMKEIAPKSDQLFVLGDLFELWLGDDCLQANNPNRQMYVNVVDLLKDYSNKTKPLFFTHGNRDFLLGKEFEKQTGGQLLDEPFFVELANQRVALMHGDTLCTDDVAYQEFRTMVRGKKWQQEFLAVPMEKRTEIAAGFKEQSKQAQRSKTAEIMDVNQQTIIDFFKANAIECLIHGHTHRQATHNFEVNGKSVQRIVLSDWRTQGFYLSIFDGFITENYFST